MRGASCRAAARLSSSPRRRSRRHTWAYERRLRHLPAGSGAERPVTRRSARIAVAGAESDLRRDRRGLDLLRRADHVRYVCGVLPARAVPLAAAARDARGDRHRRAAGADPASVRDPPGALGRADQPAPGDRRRAFLPAGRGDARFRHRVQEHRRHVRADHIPYLRAWRPRQHGRRLRRGVHLCAVHRGRRLLLRARVGLCHRLRVLHRRDVLAAPRPVRKMNYPLHLAILVLLWGYIYTSWSVMGRLGLVSFGHGAFMGIGAYTVVMLWNHFGLTPWLGAIAALIFSAVVAVVIGYPCFRFKIVGHYFALVTLALSEVARLVIVALRDQTGGPLAVTPNGALHEGATASLGALQFSDKVVWLVIVAAFWLGGLWVWRMVDRSMGRLALEAISEEEEAAASIGIHVTRAKLRITIISALMTCAGGILYTH